MKLLAAVGAFLLSGVVFATPLHNIVLFGDSLSDNGNLYEVMQHQLPQSPPYFEGRFSNGPVWVEHLASHYFPTDTSAHLLDYAIGGAGVSEEEDEDDVLFTLKREVNTYLISHNDQASADSLFVFWIGANNYLGLPTEVDQTLEEVNTGITHALLRLVDKGAKHIMVMNIPDLGSTPAAVEFDARESMGYFSTQHNLALAKTVEQLKQSHPEVEWIYFDVATMFGKVVENPSEYGLTNVTDTCSISEANAASKKSVLRMVAQVKPRMDQDDCEGYLFFDLVHPTAVAHKTIAEKAWILLDESGVKFAY